MVITAQTLAIALLGLALLALALWVFLLERRISKLLRGKDGGTLEDVITKDHRSIEEFFRFRDDVSHALDVLDERISKKLHGAKTLRFNPFQGSGQGGNQSFATALLDEHGDGVVLSTLYTREKVSVYAKPVRNRTSEFELSDEERAVLEDKE
jgi:hypothetical protein